MKVKTVIVLAALTFSALALRAQEVQLINEPPESTHRDVSLDEGKTLNDDHISPGVSGRDSVQNIQRAVPATQRGKDAPKNRKEKEEADALSFNFLYYMFQKFKLSDLIDQ